MAASRHLVLATVVEVNPGHVTYPACSTCYTKLQSLSQSEKYHCPRCKKLYDKSEIQHRYRLALTLSDQDICRKVTIFGSCVDFLFGTDATSFSRSLNHAEHCHTAVNVIDLLHKSLTESIVGHPFYFGFKSQGEFFKLKSCPTMGSSISLASLDTRDDNLVALQMMSPLQEWNFPTVMQNLLQSFIQRNAPSADRGVLHECVGDGQNACPFKSLELQPIRTKSVDKDLSSHENVRCYRSSLADTSGMVSLRSSISCSSRLSFEESSSLRGLSMSLNLPSLRLSCDTTSSSRNMASYDGSSKMCSQSPQRNSRHSFYSNLLEDVFTSQISSNETTKDDDRDRDSNFVANTSKIGCTPVEIHTKGEKNSDCRKQIKCEMEEKDTVCDTSNESENTSMHGDCGAISDVGVPAYKAVYQPKEANVDEWLEESSFDRWSFADHAQSMTHCETRYREHSRTSLGVHTNLTKRHSCVSASDTTYEFPSDMPFSEDLDQFLEDVEEKYMLSKERQDEDTQAKSNLEDAKQDETLGSRVAHIAGRNSREPCRPRSFSSTTNISASKRQSTFKLQVEEHSSASCELDEQESVSIDSCDREDLTRDSSIDNISCTYPVIKDSLYMEEPDEVEDSVCYGDHSRGMRRMENSFINNGNGKMCNEEIKCLDTKDMKNAAEDQSDILKRVKGFDQGISCDFDRHLSGKDRIEVILNSQEYLEENNENLNSTTSPTCSSNRNSEMGNDTDAYFIIPDSPEYIECSQSPNLFSQSQSSNASSPGCICESQKRPLNNQGVRSRLKPHLYQTGDCRDEESTSESCHKENQSPGERPGTTVLSPNGSGSCSPEQYEGTPDLFSQALKSETRTQRSTVFPRMLPRMSMHRKKLTPFRELFVQRAKSWKMSSTPRTGSKKNLLVGRTPMESPNLFGTPDLFSPESSPDNDSICHQSESERKETCSNESQNSDFCESFECTPDLF